MPAKAGIQSLKRLFTILSLLNYTPKKGNRSRPRTTSFSIVKNSCINDCKTGSLQVDRKRLIELAGHRFSRDTVTTIDPEKKKVCTSGRKWIDICHKFLPPHQREFLQSGDTHADIIFIIKATDTGSFPKLNKISPDRTFEILRFDIRSSGFAV